MVHQPTAGRVIRLKLLGKLEHRDLAVRAVASACKLVPRTGADFHHAVVSAFSEALNNVILHGQGSVAAELEIDIELGADRLTIRLRDYGKAFDPMTLPTPDLESLPESGLGVFIMRSFMDEVVYTGGTPNVLSMTKFSKGAIRQ